MSQRTKKCTCCGQQVPARMRYCGWCGWDLEGSGDKEEAPPRPREEALPRPVRVANAPRPVETSRWVDKEASRSVYDDDRPERRNVLPIIAAVCVTLAVIAVAVALVIRMNLPIDTQDQAQGFEGVHVLNPDGSTPTPAPTGSTPTPAPSPSPSPSATPKPTETPAPTEAPDVVTEVDDIVYVNGSGVRLRSGPSTTDEVVTTLPNGTELKRTGTVNGWSRVVYNGQECYISDALISTEAPKPTPTPTPTPSPKPADYTVTVVDDTVTVTSDANIRSGPGTDYEKIASALKGTELKRTGTANGWSRVEINGQEGFIFDGLITTGAAAAEAGGEAQTASAGTLTVISPVNIRSGPGQGYEIIGTADTGDKLDLLDDSGAWYKIDYEGKTAYVYSQYVTKD